MQTTTTTPRTLGTLGWMRVALLTAGLALLVTVTPQPAGAEKLDPMANATQQARNCELMGGEATVETHRTPGGSTASAVKCAGGAADGISCYNDQEQTKCYHKDINFAAPVEGWHVSPVEVVELVESGARVPIATVVAAFNADSGVYGEPTSARSAASDHGGDVDADKASKYGEQDKKGKHGKGGKNRGKGHRK